MVTHAECCCRHLAVLLLRLLWLELTMAVLVRRLPGLYCRMTTVLPAWSLLVALCEQVQVSVSCTASWQTSDFSKERVFVCKNTVFIAIENSLIQWGECLQEFSPACRTSCEVPS